MSLSTRSRLPRADERVQYAPAPRIPHAGRVAIELGRRTGWSVRYAQKVLGAGREIRIAGLIIESHVAAADLGASFIERIQPIEAAMAAVPAEPYAGAMEVAEQECDGAEDVDQARYQAEQTADNARRRIRSNAREIAKLAGINRSLAARHGLQL